MKRNLRIGINNLFRKILSGRSPMDTAKIFALLCSLCFFKPSSAQVADSTAAEDTFYYYTYIPKYEWSVGVEHSYIPGILKKDAFYPDNIEISFWLHQRLYFRAG